MIIEKLHQDTQVEIDEMDIYDISEFEFIIERDLEESSNGVKIGSLYIEIG